MHRLIVEVAGREAVEALPMIRHEALLARAIACAVQEVEALGHRAVGVRVASPALGEATRLVLALRDVSPELTEEELVLLLDLLPL